MHKKKITPTTTTKTAPRPIFDDSAKYLFHFTHLPTHLQRSFLYGRFAFLLYSHQRHHHHHSTLHHHNRHLSYAVCINKYTQILYDRFSQNVQAKTDINGFCRDYSLAGIDAEAEKAKLSMKNTC